VRGGPEFDDAWDEGALLSMMARNFMRSSGVPLRFQFPSRKYPKFDDPRNQSMMTNLHPTMAMVEGLPDAIAAIALKTPYLTAASGKEVRDISKTNIHDPATGDIIEELPLDIYSAPAITAFTWELALKANGITSPGDHDAWKEMENLSINRFYSLQNVYFITDEETGNYQVTDFPSLFTQLATMSYTQGSTEPIDLAEIFTDEVITQMTTEFFNEEIWPRPTEGTLSCFITDWGNNPKTPLPEVPFTFSMHNAVMDATEEEPYYELNGVGPYSNLTFKENFSARLQLSQDTAYWLSVIADPPLPPDASIEVRVNGSVLSSYIFKSSSPEQRIVLLGNSDSPTQYILDFSLKSPKDRVPDSEIDVRLELAY
jgi:hypothetical protein